MTLEHTDEEGNYFTTRDLPLASALVTLKFNLVNIDFQIEGDKQQPIGYFSFEITPELKKAEQEFWQGKLYGELRSFSANLKALKGQVTQLQRNPYNKR